MTLLQSSRVECPYCGETIELLVDCSISPQVYIEDCAVCCQPITVAVEIDADYLPIVTARHENDV